MNNSSYQFTSSVAKIDLSKIVDMSNFYEQGNRRGSTLTRKLVYLIGSRTPSFPLSTQLLGGSYYNISNIKPEDPDGEKDMYLKSTIKVIATDEYSYPVMGDYIKGGIISKSVVGNQGLGCKVFKVTFTNNYLTKGFMIQSPMRMQLYVEDVEPTPSGEFIYSLKVAHGSNMVCPESELKAGTVWIELFAPIAQKGSRNINIGKAITAGSNKNQITKMRCGLTWTADVADAMTSVFVIEDGKNGKTLDLNTDNNPKRLFIDQYTYNYEENCLRMVEHCLWSSKYNRNQDGSVNLVDSFSGEVIQMGAGLLEQIGNKSSFSSFNYAFLNKVIMKKLYGIKGLSKQLTLYGGTLALRMFHKAMMDKGYEFFGSSGYTGVGDKFITGTNESLMLGGFFKGFYNIDGWIVKIKHTSVFEEMFLNSPIDAESGLPISSGDMVLIDDGDTEGENNLQLVIGKGYNPYTHVLRRGITNIPSSIKALDSNSSIEKGDGSIPIVSTDLEESSYMRFYKVGIQLLRANTSFYLRFMPSQYQ